jgi:maltose O-acetyltransferase
VPDDIEAMTLRERVMARLRGQQTLSDMRKRGLRAQAPVRIESPSFVDPVFAWAIEIGAYTIISREVQIYAHDAAVKRLTGYTEIRPVTIGERCYIGAGCIILPGSVVGDEAIVGAGSLVRGEIPARSLAVGNPAKVIASVDDLRERHLRNLESFPKSSQRVRDLDRSEIPRLRAELEEHGRVYAP